MSLKPGDLVKWKRLDEIDACDGPCIVLKGPREGYFEHPPWNEIKLVVDLFVDNRVIKGVPIEEVEKWK